MSVIYLRGDCIEVMKSFPDKSIDCFICDLPYGQLNSPKIGGQANIRFSKDRITWDVKIDLNAFWTEVIRLCKSHNTPILMFCNTKFGIDLINSNPSWFRYDLVWDKQRGVSFLLANKQPMKSHEMIYVFSKKAPYYKRIDSKSNKEQNALRCPLSVIQIVGKKKPHKNAHPTEKPSALYKWLLERYCPVEGTVLDPTAGSFNSIVVAKELGLHGIGIEKDDTFFSKAVDNAIIDSDTE